MTLTPIDMIYPVLTLAYMGLEYWFGKTDKVKAGSLLEFVLVALKAVVKTKKQGE